MADITLAEFNGRVWLVGGEDYLHALLGNALPKDVSIEFVQCERPEEVKRLWIQNCGEGPANVGGVPWQIHPNIVARIRRSSPDLAVYFGQWSAMLDQDALLVVSTAAAHAADLPEAAVVLALFLDPDGPRAMVDLASLRAQLITDKLAEHGVDPARIQRLVRDTHEIPGMGQESQRIDVIVRAA